jgi:hypothetical protein
MRKSFAVDLKDLPVARLDYYDLLSDDEFEEQLAAVDRLLERALPFVLVVRTHHQRMMPMSQVRRQVQHMKTQEQTARHLMRGLALVIPSSVIRGVLKVVMGMAPIPVPHGVFDSDEAAVTWARERMASSRSGVIPRL